MNTLETDRDAYDVMADQIAEQLDQIRDHGACSERGDDGDPTWLLKMHQAFELLVQVKLSLTEL